MPSEDAVPQENSQLINEKSGKAKDYEVGYGKPPKSGQFKPGDDPRRNLKGAPRKRDVFREFVLDIGSEPISKKSPITRMQRKIRRMWDSDDPRDSNRILDEAFGKLAQDVTVRTWRDEVIELLKTGKVTNEQVKAELGDDLATELIVAAGLSSGESGETSPPDEEPAQPD